MCIGEIATAHPCFPALVLPNYPVPFVDVEPSDGNLLHIRPQAMTSSQITVEVIRIDKMAQRNHRLAIELLAIVGPPD